MARIAGRWIHPASGRVYNETFAPPRVPGKDDITGEALVRRPDDEPATVAKRLQHYNEATQPILQHYKQHYASRFHNIKCETSPEGTKMINEILSKQ